MRALPLNTPRTTPPTPSERQDSHRARSENRPASGGRPTSPSTVTDTGNRATPSPRPPSKERSQASKDQLGSGAVGRRGAKEYIHFQTRTRDAALRHVNDTKQRAASFRFSRDSARGRLGGGRRKWELFMSDLR